MVFPPFHKPSSPLSCSSSLDLSPYPSEKTLLPSVPPPRSICRTVPKGNKMLGNFWYCPTRTGEVCLLQVKYSLCTTVGQQNSFHVRILNRAVISLNTRIRIVASVWPPSTETLETEMTTWNKCKQYFYLAY